MRKLTHDEIPRPDPHTLQSLPRHPIHVVAHNIRSIHNVGSIFRTSDAARIQHLHLTGFSGTPEHHRLHKAALGAQDVVPWSYEPSVAAVVDRLREDGARIGVLEITDAPTAVDSLTEADFPLVLVLGNEVDGVPDELVAQADFAVEIPQFGMKQSLNVSVAFGIAIFDLVRHYRSLTAISDRLGA